ncbi:sulfatase-like hydrolase/transferase [Hyphomonas sp.]|uniref:sulfatase-like hydrolase/transferase n=1 Tax=Hyphomonas sp. TaxID=87 RepID=UPI0025BA7C37|nr:sulfatase-like hydrolase/transferase [Hyphomonas sp.]
MRILVAAIVAFFLVDGEAAPQADPAPARPNFVVMIIDDAAFMDLGAYGGEARTPNIDALAARGALFTRYYSSPLCSPSRAMLLTGMDNHLTGVSTIPEVLPREHEGQPGYTMRLEPGVATLAERLKPLGYRTLMTGKWHLGSGEGDLPKAHGFDRSFALDASGADNWEDKSYMPYYADAPWYEDDVPASLPDDFYSSEFIVDQMMTYMDEGDAEAPFFAYLAFMAVHIPVQAPPEFTANYAGVYDAGWDATRAARWERAKERGYVPADAALAPMPANFRPWDSLPAEEQKLYAARMQVNAGMLEAMDHHVGRLIEHLKSTGRYDNTVFVVTSDNGPEPSRGDTDPRLKFWMDLNGYHLDLEGMGEKGSWAFIGPEWAMAAASPHDKFKFLGSEGGIRVPFIMSGAGLGEGGRVDARAFVTDVAPTLLALAGGGPEPDGAKPMTGRSLVPLLRGETDAVYGPDDAIVIEVSGNAAVIKGDYKLTRNQLPHGDARWRLYDLSKDPGETTDLSASFPEIYDDLSTEYAAYSKRVGVLEVPEGYNSLDEVTRHSLVRQQERYRPYLIGGGIALFAIIAGVVLLWRRRKQKA